MKKSEAAHISRDILSLMNLPKNVTLDLNRLSGWFLISDSKDVEGATFHKHLQSTFILFLIYFKLTES